MVTGIENNSPFKQAASPRIAAARKLPRNLAEFLGEFPANPRLSELILRAVTHMKENAQRMPTENEAFALGILSYIYSFPVVELCRILYGLASEHATSDGWNRLRILSETSDRSWNIVKTNDLAYCVAPLDLCREPVLFHAFDPGERYCSYQFIDAHANTFAHLGTRDKELYQRTYAIVGPGWRGKRSPDLTWIPSPTRQNLLIGRIGVDNDAAAAREIFSRCTLASLSGLEKGIGNDLGETRWLPEGQEIDLRDLKWFEFASDVLNANPPPACDNDLAPQFARVGFERGVDFRTASVSPNVRSGLKRAIPVAKAEIASHAKMLGETNYGWHTLSSNLRIRDGNYLDRAAYAIDRLTGPPVDELFSAECRSDESGKPLSGLHRYVLRFEKGQRPPSDSFWSISVYERPGHFFVDKVLEVQPGCGSRRLKYGDDGSLEIRIQNPEPESSSCNWLRTPRSRFSILFRVYAPREEIVNGLYRLSAVRSLTH